MSKAQYIMIGGFLGAGKTTAILKIAERFRDQGLRVGLITNDQSYGLVDTGLLASHGFDVAEITGGCFCCKFNSLVEAGERLSEKERPDVFIAEPVGSCTDLKATVDYPLRRMYGDDFEIAPLSVLVDPQRAMQILGLKSGKSFSEKVIYIYGKQLEEAEIIVVNKIDTLEPQALAALQQALQQRYPQARVVAISARQGTELETWLTEIREGGPTIAGAMEVDYDLYADGEALLGWLNSAIQLTAETAAGVDGNELLLTLAKKLHSELESRDMQIAHLKMTLTPTEGNDIAVGNLVRNNVAPELSHQLAEPLGAGELILNLRAEADPEDLRTIVEQTIAALAQERKLELKIEHLEAFRPGRPTPTHRLQGV